MLDCNILVILQFLFLYNSQCHIFDNNASCQKGFLKGEALCLLRTNSVRENFEQSTQDFEHRLCQKGYPLTLGQEILTEVKFTAHCSTQQNKTNKRDFTVCYYPQSGHTKSKKDSHETVAHHSTVT